MKILLLGEFSALHKNLKEGLIELGHDVTIMSSGDGFKKIDCDIHLPKSGMSIYHKLKYRIDFYKIMRDIKGFDVVQIINPFIFPMRLFPEKHVIKLIKARNSKLFLLGAGSDSYFWLFGRKRLKYGPFDDFLKYDKKSAKDPRESSQCFSFNKYVADLSNGVIPVMYEYAVSYKDHKNLRPPIPLPINTNRIKYQPNIAKNKIIIFHGLTRYGFKGTRHVEQAFEVLSKKYPNDLKLVMDGLMPMDKYLELMSRTNVSIDQTNSYSCGVNGVYALAMGKIVMGGAEPESLSTLGVKESPVINILPSKDDIVNKIELLLEKRKNFEQLGYESRVFAETVHGHIPVAEKYVKAWSEV
jgi:hypothetical protein